MAPGDDKVPTIQPVALSTVFQGQVDSKLPGSTAKLFNPHISGKPSFLAMSWDVKKVSPPYTPWRPTLLLALIQNLELPLDFHSQHTASWTGDSQTINFFRHPPRQDLFRQKSLTGRYHPSEANASFRYFILRRSGSQFARAFWTASLSTTLACWLISPMSLAVTINRILPITSPDLRNLSSVCKFISRYCVLCSMIHISSHKTVSPTHLPSKSQPWVSALLLLHLTARHIALGLKDQHVP